jgi:biopolymer transport protein TolQ
MMLAAFDWPLAFPLPVGHLLAQLEAASAPTMWSSLITDDPVHNGVLIFLAVLSLLSWGVVFSKFGEFRRAEKQGRAFVREFEKASSVENAMLTAQRVPSSPYTVVFARAVQFLNETTPALPGSPERSARLSGSQVEALRFVLDAESGSEREKLGRFIPWLATVGSVSPLIGLLGTVLGVIRAFFDISVSGSSNLAAVGPGIAQALSATAAALAVAIPASFAFNVFAARLNRYDSALEGFGSELVALLVREGRI